MIMLKWNGRLIPGFAGGAKQRVLTRGEARHETADSELAEFRRNGSSGRRAGHKDREHEPSRRVIQYPCQSIAAAQSKGKTSGVLAQLEAENAWLRNRAVELALEIQVLCEGAPTGT
jgi:hypothetical protein